MGTRKLPVKGAYVPAKELSSPLLLREFGVARDRDGEGRYSAGNVPGADDYAIAGMARKKKVAVGAGAGVLAAGALGMTGKGRNAASSIVKGATRMVLGR